MEINQLDQVNSATAQVARPEEPKRAPRETEAPAQNLSNNTREAFRVELSEEAKAKQAEEKLQAESEQPPPRQNNTYNAAGEIAG